MSERIGIVVLAAGGSARMGRPKQSLPFGGRSLLRHLAEVAAACGPAVVVLGRDYESLLPEIQGLALRVVHNERWAEGMGTSIAAGVKIVETMPDASGVLLMTCDQPGVNPETLHRLLRAWSTGGCGIAACAYSNTIGVPAVFSRSWFPLLLSLREKGAKELINTHREDVAAVPAPEAAADLDTPEDYLRLMSRPEKER